MAECDPTILYPRLVVGTAMQPRHGPNAQQRTTMNLSTIEKVVAVGAPLVVAGWFCVTAYTTVLAKLDTLENSVRYVHCEILELHPNNGTPEFCSQIPGLHDD